MQLLSDAIIFVARRHLMKRKKSPGRAVREVRELIEAFKTDV